MKSVDVISPLDFNGREAAQFVRLLSEKVKYSVFIEKDDRQINAHSILGMLSLCIKMGDKLKIHSDNDDALKFTKDLFSII